MPRMIFVNLPVRDLSSATRFYEAIGCRTNEQFSDDKASSMMWSDIVIFQLLSHDYFKTFARKPIADARTSTATLIALSCESRDEVDAITEAAAAAGGRADIRERQDMGFMYLRSFEDPDGHVFEPAWMDMAAASGSGERQAAPA